MTDPVFYRIRVRGLPSSSWTVWFEGLSITEASDGVAELSGRVADQAALHGVLARIRDLGLELVSVTALPDPSAQPEV